jgi:hypothetical protein
MDKQEISRKLDEIVVARLFSASSWLVNRETAAALQSTLLQMNLGERVPGQNDTWRSTPLGEELNLDLLMVFMGLWNEWDMLYVLERFGLIDKSQSEAMFDLLSQGIDPESVLRGPAQQAYHDYYNPSKIRH